MVCLLENYPFKNIGVKAAEGFLAYEGNLRNVPGKRHGGIDYVLNKNGEFASFEVYSMFEGDVEFGVSPQKGKYFIVSKEAGEWRVSCVYAHLDNINEDLQKYAIIQGDRDFMVPSKYFLGWASSSGNATSVRHLHIELFAKNLVTGEQKKFDPYGIYKNFSDGSYPQPGQSLAGLNHCWVSDEPEFIR